ncbi:MAG: hypothetical protein OXP36_12400, partial [Gammaproteobacteria bacterium]|nr:hypothetical protein [Gammaproteobacteria bacterium]
SGTHRTATLHLPIPKAQTAAPAAPEAPPALSRRYEIAGGPARSEAGREHARPRNAAADAPVIHNTGTGRRLTGGSVNEQSAD